MCLLQAPSKGCSLWFFSLNFFWGREDLSVLPSALREDVRRTLRKTFIYLVPSPIFLPPPSLCLTGCCAHWLHAWMFDSLSHWTLTGTPFTLCTSVAEAGAQRGGGAAQALGSHISRSEISPSFCFYWTIKWEQRTALSPPPPLSLSLSLSPALTTDSHCWAASMTLHTWMVNGLGFILVWTLCLTQGE